MSFQTECGTNSKSHRGAVLCFLLVCSIVYLFNTKEVRQGSSFVLPATIASLKDLGINAGILLVAQEFISISALRNKKYITD